MRLRRRFVLAVQTQRARRPNVDEVRPLCVHVVVHPEDHDVVLPHEIGFGRVHWIAVDAGGVVAIVPVSVLVRDDHVEAGGGRLLHNLERAEHRRRDAFYFCLWPAELERVAICCLAPRYAEIRFDPVDDVACRESHYVGLQ
jgi:hypothetical protein